MCYMYYTLSAFILTIVHMIIVIITTVIFIVLYPTDTGEHTMLYNL